jgi:hypothetical protein
MWRHDKKRIPFPGLFTLLFAAILPLEVREPFLNAETKVLSTRIKVASFFHFFCAVAMIGGICAPFGLDPFCIPVHERLHSTSEDDWEQSWCVGVSSEP